jgi:hypothetical protein
MVRIESSVKSTTYILVNTRPIVTGACPGLVLAPYNALYRKLSLDLMCIGISPLVSLWDQPVMLGSLGSQQPEKMSPAVWSMVSIPFSWKDVEPVINAVVPPDYLHHLEMRRNQIMNLKDFLKVIEEKNPDLAAKLVQQIKAHAEKSMQLGELQWLAAIEKKQEQTALVRQQAEEPQ